MTAGQAGLREEIFGEIKGRTKETDLSVPTRRRGWWYYARTVEGKQYARALPSCRPDGRRAAADDRGRIAAGRRGDPARRQRARRGPAVLLARRAQREPGRLQARLLDRLRRRRALHDALQGSGHRRARRRRDPRHLLRLGLVARRLGAVLRDGRRRVAALPDLAACARDAGRAGRDRVRGDRRAVLRRCLADPQRALRGDLELLEAHQRGVAARRRRPDRPAHGSWRRAGRASSTASTIR